MATRLAWLVLMGMGIMAGGCTRPKGEVQGGTPKPSEEFAPLTVEGAPPQLAVGNLTHNFGTMDQQTLGSHQFEVGNQGEGNLLLRIQHTTCGCTSVKLGEDVVWNPKEPAPKRIVTVPPGQKVIVEMNWNTEQRSGEFRTAANVETNDARNRLLIFTIQGEIIPYVEVTQSQVRIEDASNGEVTSRSTFVYSRKYEDLEIVDVTSSNPLITAEFEPSPSEFNEAMKAKSGVRAQIKVQPGMPIGPFNASMVLKTNHEERPEVPISVVGYVVGDVLLTPENVLNYGIVKATEGSTKIIFIKVRTEEKAEVKVIKVEPDFLKVSLKEFESGKNRWQLKAEVPVGAPGGQFKGIVELETTHPTAKNVKIPVRLQVSK